MSWYFLGGFSAYWIVPSGRCRNHSGCSLTHGWSGEHWKRDVERDLEAELARRARRGASKSSSVPSSGCDGGVAALARRRSPTGCRGRRARPTSVLLRPLAVRAADGMDRRQVEDVEAHAGDVGEAIRDVAERAVPAGLGRRRAREALVPGAEGRALDLDVDRQRLVERGRRRRDRGGAPSPSRARARARPRCGSRASAGSRRAAPRAPPSAMPRRRRSRVRAAARTSAAPSSSSLVTSWPASTLRGEAAAPGARSGRSTPRP